MILMSIRIDFSRMIPWIPVFIEGTLVTIVLSLLTVMGGSVLGLLAAVMRRSRIRVIRGISGIYSQVIRGTPMLVQLLIWLYAFPQAGIKFPAIEALGPVYGSREFVTAAVALSFNSGAYISELLRAGLESIPKGQTEAGLVLGLSEGTVMRKIVVPQAVRVILPGIANEFITLIKESSIVSTVGIFDLTYSSNIVKASTFSVFEPLIIVALIYLMLTFVTSQLLGYFEKRGKLKDA